MLGVSVGHKLRVHINRVEILSPNPTTGEALYILGGIGKNEKLYREIAGDQEDEGIVRDDLAIELTQDAHFYSQKTIEILVNGSEHEIETKEIDYGRVVDLYLGSGGAASTEFLVKYSHGPHQNPTGTLAPGQKVKVKHDMRFRVAGTGES